jgi:hypothetical protein
MSLLPKGQVMIRKLSLLIAAATALAACNNDPIEGKEAPDPMAGELANAAPVELPPAITASKTYRCADNSLAKVEWLSDNSAYVHGEGGSQTQVKPAVPAEGKPASTDLVAEGGYALSGNAAGSSITITLPGKGKRVCHV